jgi:hypothetical protein
MALFETLEVLERQVFDTPNLADADANVTRQGRGVWCIHAGRLRHGPLWTRRGFGNTSTTLIRQKFTRPRVLYARGYVIFPH